MDELNIPREAPADLALTPDEGLTEAEAAKRMADGQGNAVEDDPGRSVPQIVCANLFTLFNLLNVALAAALAFVGAYRNMLFMGVVVSNTLIGTVQELRAHATLRKLKLMNTPNIRVRREGREQVLPADQLVQGDVVVLTAGNQVPADAVVRAGAGAANESLLTGESDPVSKQAGDWLMSGSYITEGTFTAQLVHVGAESYISRLTRSAKKIKRSHSALMSDMQRLVRVVSILLVPIGLLLLGKQLLVSHAPLTTAIPTAVAAMIGMIPEGLMLLTSMALTVGVITLGRRKVLVQELYGIETLARADVLCLDKTGTITTGEMAFETMIVLTGEESEAREAMTRFLGAMPERSATTTALAKAFPTQAETPRAVLPFSSARKKSAVTLADGRTLVLGAPSFVLEDGQMTEAVRRRMTEAAAAGRRVLMLAECGGPIDGTSLPPVTRLLALVCLTDVVRDNAPQTLRYFREQGVQLKIISGDDPVTVSAIGRQIGLDGAEDCVDASTLTTPEALRTACDRYTVFGRVTPDQKRALVEALKAAGHSVAMTGDGVNDIPALKAADCSIAMAGGSDAAKHAAQLTLLDPDFASLPAVVGEGRRVVNNITRASSLFLVKTLYSFALALLMLALPAAYPFQPIQLTVISTLTIGVPSFFLALEPNHDPIRGRFLRTVLLRAIPGAASVAVCAAIAMMLVHIGWSAEACSTLATAAAAWAGVLFLAGVCWPFSKLRAAVLAAMAAGMVLAFLLFGPVFYIVPLTGTQYAALGGLMVLVLIIMTGTRWVMGHMEKREKPIVV